MLILDNSPDEYAILIVWWLNNTIARLTEMEGGGVVDQTQEILLTTFNLYFWFRIK